MRSYKFLIILVLLTVLYQSLAMEEDNLIASTEAANYLLALEDDVLFRFITPETTIVTHLDDIIMPPSAGYHFTQSQEVVADSSVELTTTASRKKRPHHYNFSGREEASLAELQQIAPHFGLNQLGQESKHQMPHKNLTICPFDNCKKKLSTLFKLMQHITLIHVPLKVHCPETRCSKNKLHTLAAVRCHLTRKHKDVEYTNAVIIATFKEKLQQSLQLHFPPLQIDSIQAPREHPKEAPREHVLTTGMMPSQQFTPELISQCHKIAPYFGFDIDGQEIYKITKQHNCIFCPKTFPSTSQLTRHIVGHLPLNLTCPECNIIFEHCTINQLSRHLQSKHPEYKLSFTHMLQIYKNNLQKILQSTHSIISGPVSTQPQAALSSHEIRQMEPVQMEETGLLDAHSESMLSEKQTSVQDDLIASLKEEFHNNTLEPAYCVPIESLQEEPLCTDHFI